MKNFARLAFLGVALVAAPFASANSLTVNSIAAGSYGTSTGVSVGGSYTPTANAGDPTPFTATYTETIYKGGTASEVQCATCLNFVFTVQNTTTGPDFIENISIANWGTFTTLLGDVTGSGSESLNAATMSGGVFNTTFNNLYTTATLDTFVIFTNATGYKAGDITFQDGATVDAPALVAATPEPNSLMLLGSGLVSAGGMLLRRNKIKA